MLLSRSTLTRGLLLASKSPTSPLARITIGYHPGCVSLLRLPSPQSSPFGTLGTPTESSKSTDVSKKGQARDRQYYWIEPEAETLIAKAYARHRVLALESLQQIRDPEHDPDAASQSQTAGYEIKSFPPSLAMSDLETVGTPVHFAPEGFGDRVALRIVKVLERFMEMFFREKYDHHAVTLETVAAVPGIVAAAHRHLRSLRTMRRDHGWINPLQEEAENERMHLLIWMQHTKPTRIERYFVMLAQASYVSFYSLLYAISPRIAHRTTGYLEEAAHRAYTDFLKAIDEGRIDNVPAGKIAKKYYRLGDDARLRDVVLHVRGDECMHRDYNHHLSNLYRSQRQDEYPKKLH